MKVIITLLFFLFSVSLKAQDKYIVIDSLYDLAHIYSRLSCGYSLLLDHATGGHFALNKEERKIPELIRLQKAYLYYDSLFLVTSNKADSLYKTIPKKLPGQPRWITDIIDSLEGVIPSNKKYNP